MSPSNPPPPQPTDAGFFSVINFCTRLKEAAHLILHPQEKTPLNYPPSEAHSIFTSKSDDISESRGVHTHTHTHTHTSIHTHTHSISRESPVFPTLRVTRMSQWCTFSGVMSKTSYVQWDFHHWRISPSQQSDLRTYVTPDTHIFDGPTSASQTMTRWCFSINRKTT